MSETDGMLLYGDAELAAEIERAEAENHAEYVKATRRLRPDVDAAVLRLGGGVAAYAGAGDPLTQAFGLGLDGPVPDETIESLVEFYRSREVPVAVEVCNLADPSLANGLIARGCVVDEQTHVLARGPGSGDVKAPGDSVRLIGPEDLAQWSDVLTRGFTEGEAHEGLMAVCASFHAQENASCFGAWRDGRLVGGGCVFFVGELAVLGGASTLPEARGRGVQRDLLLARLALAFERGVRLAVVSTSPGSISQRNAMRVGFSIVYARTKFVGADA